MLPSAQTLDLAMPTFFRKILVDLPHSDEALIDFVEDRWKTGQIPDLKTVVESVSPGDPDRVIPEIIMVDMEWRWKSTRPELQRDLRDYDLLLRQPMSAKDRARVLCREFGIRNRWGDFVPRDQLCVRHPELKDLFVKFVDKEIRDIADWPEIRLLQQGRTIATAHLDRLVTAGRQSSSDQTPWSVLTFDYSHHLVLCDMQNPQLSREQLEFRLISQKRISIRNASRSRAVAIRSSRTAIDAGQVCQCTLEKPVRIHLIGEYDILVAQVQG